MTENPRPAISGTLYSDNGAGVVRMKSRFEADINDVWSALTVPERLARWYGTVRGDLRVGGEFSAVVFGSGWDGRGRIDVCVPPQKLEVIQWEEEGPETRVEAELAGDDQGTMLVIDTRGMPLDVLWAFGCGWQTHVEDLAAHLAGNDPDDWPSRWGTRFDELEPFYRAMTVVPLER
jgi:uncharacterized protein YndB with AHSA1/START domain